jgi:hypothetical protein
MCQWGVAPVVSMGSYFVFFAVETIQEVYLFFLDCLTLKMETLLYVETSGIHTKEKTRRRTIGPFEKSELQGNVWQDIVMKFIKRRDRHK